MRHIERVCEPVVLVKRGVEWQGKFDKRRAADPHARPDSSKYGHPKIKDALVACSSDKCFYCESKLTGDVRVVEHFIEVAIAPELSYTWTNLYLSCQNCNNKKLDHRAVPAENVLDPCKDSDEVIQDNITFDKECVYSQYGSVKGLNTIKKFSLNSEQLTYKRMKWLQKVSDDINEIRKRMHEEKREATEVEKNKLRRYMQKDQPYSLMCEIYIEEACSDLIA